ncbi:MAG TPA: NlpC/P60 family protein [Frankiaceae bacterium]|nr:NlpC/P60 family protein [Frankiaceae bacterium]
MRLFHPGLRHARRPAAAVAALALAGSGLVAAAAPAAAAQTTTVSVSPFRISKAVGSTATFYVTLAASGTRLPGKTVSIYTRHNSTSWVKRWTRTLNSNGQTAVAFTVQRSTYVMAKFAGTSAYAGDTSGAAYVTAVDTSFGTKVINEASRHAGKPYQWGAAGPDRFDCSGYTMYVFGRLGKSLPHNSRMQYNAVRHVAKADKKVGDLIFTYNSNGIHHVAIYAGNGYIWHSPRSGTVVNKSKMWSTSYYVGRVA